MKSLLTFVMMLSSFSAFASEPTFELNTGSLRLIPIAGKVTQVSPLCPAIRGLNCFTSGTVIDLQFETGCLNGMTPVVYDAIEKNGELHVYVSAHLILSEASRQARCAKSEIVNQQISLINRYGDVKVHFLGATYED